MPESFENDSPLFWPIVKLNEAYRSGDISPVEVLEEAILRAEAFNPSLNAYLERLDKQARQQAKAAEKKIDFKIKYASHRGSTFQLFETLLIGCNSDGTRFFESCCLPGLFLQTCIEFGCVLGEFCDVCCGPQLTNQASSMPSRSTSQSLAFNNGDILPS